MRTNIAVLVATLVVARVVTTGLVDHPVMALAEETDQQAESSMPLPLKVVGTQILNSRGEPVRLRGVNTACLEWTSDGEGHILDTVKTAIVDWKVNHIRLPLAQDRWFGKAPEQNDDGQAYRALVKQVVDYTAAHGCYIIIDLHWSDAGQWGSQIGQHVMPDKNTAAFWKDFATRYKNHPAVIFDLYNEPHDVSWDIWLNGGTVTDRDRRWREPRTYEAVGMQPLLDVVRATGAKNLVVVGGIDWAYDLSGILDGRQLSDPHGNGVIYACHAYPFKGDTVEEWIAKMQKATKEFPVLVGEFGAESRGRGYTSGEHWVRLVLKALEENGWHWSAWDLHPSAGPRLISDWNYTPTPGFGVWVKHALHGTLPEYTATEPPPASDPPTARRNRRSGMSRLFGVIPAVSLAQLTEIQQELKLSDEQKEVIVQLNEQLNDQRRQLFQDAAGDFDRMREGTAQLNAKFAAQLDAALEESQQQRMQALYVRVNGAVALNDDSVAKALQLSEDQRSQLREAAEASRQSVFAAFRDFQDMSDEQRAEKVEELIRDRENSLLAALTAAQRTRFEQLKGKVIEVNLDNLPGPGR